MLIAEMPTKNTMENENASFWRLGFVDLNHVRGGKGWDRERM
jgi:hypothetical protein